MVHSNLFRRNRVGSEHTGFRLTTTREDTHDY